MHVLYVRVCVLWACSCVSVYGLKAPRAALVAALAAALAAAVWTVLLDITPVANSCWAFSKLAPVVRYSAWTWKEQKGKLAGIKSQDLNLPQGLEHSTEWLSLADVISRIIVTMLMFGQWITHVIITLVVFALAHISCHCWKVIATSQALFKGGV